MAVNCHTYATGSKYHHNLRLRHSTRVVAILLARNNLFWSCSRPQLAVPRCCIDVSLCVRIGVCVFLILLQFPFMCAAALLSQPLLPQHRPPALKDDVQTRVHGGTACFHNADIWQDVRWLECTCFMCFISVHLQWHYVKWASSVGHREKARKCLLDNGCMEMNSPSHWIPWGLGRVLSVLVSTPSIYL